MPSDLTRPIIGIENRTAQEVFDIMCDRFRMSEAEAEALSRTGAVKVKALEWDAIDGGNAFRAPALIFGWIRIESYTLHSWQVQWSAPGICNLLLPSVFNTPDEAKAAAQADYERRILSALDLAAPEGQQEHEHIEVTDAGLIQFAEWFRKNYPGPDTIIHKPDWHAPKIYRAARHAMRQQEPEGQQPVAWQHRYRTIGKEIGEWSEWADGRAPEWRSSSYEAEERPLFTRPTEQAVTEAAQVMLEAIDAELDTDIRSAAFLGRVSRLRNALKASMEAGRQALASSGGRK